MQECIICRKQKKKNEFNDEHVIPDAIGGYYHINKVCISCNSDIGNAIDVKLTNHFLTKFNRYQLGLKGKKGDLPNPFSGTHVLRDNPKQKIRYDLKEGGFTSYLIPNLEWQDDVLKITIDAKDKDKLPALIQKQTKRLTKEGKRLSHQSKMNEHETPHPSISIKSTIDINDFKLSLIKIAYEFTVDTIPEYYNDSQAIIISKAIKNKDFTYDNIQLLGDGFDRTLFTPFSHYFEFENLKKHYIILASINKIGLVCGVNIFDAFSIFVVMSSREDYLSEGNSVVGINDIEAKNFKILDIYDVIAQLFNSRQYQFEYFFENIEGLNSFKLNQDSPDFGFFSFKNKTPLFNKFGEILYADIGDKLFSSPIMKIPFGDSINEVGDIFPMDEELYIKTLPDNKLAQVVTIKSVSRKNGKL